MFTGIIQSMGIISKKGKNTLMIEVCDSHVELSESDDETYAVLSELKIGSSIAVDGCCLTVTAKDKISFTADVMPITFERTTLGARRKGHPVNLELAMRGDKRFEGHIVAGHVEGTTKLKSLKILDNAYLLTFELPRDLERYVVRTGSIAINGISLTVVDASKVGEKSPQFSVSIIPHTWENTNLRELTVGDKVNIETDILAKYAERLSQS